MRLYPLAPIWFRFNKYLTNQEQSKTPRDKFYKDLLELNENGSVVDFEGRTMIRLMKQILLEAWIAKLEAVCKKLRPIVLSRTSAEVGGQARGKHAAVRFGSIIERGGSGKIRVSKDNVDLHEFIDENTELWNFIAMLFALLCPEEAQIMLTVPEELRIFGGMFTAAYWNLEPLNRVHRDTRDWRWCCAIAFGGFKKGKLDFPVINCSVGLMRLDLCFFWSKKMFHSVVDADPTRQTLILTNHTAVIQRYNKHVTDIKYSHM